MNLLRIVFELFALYLLYKLVFDFIIPLVNTTRQVKKQFTDINAQMQEKMKQQANKQPSNTYNTAKDAPIDKNRNDDYIDFEEIK